MAADFTLAVRRAVVSHLSASLTTPVHGEYVPGNPSYPFIRYGAAITTPFEAQCWDGSTHAITIHVFTNGPTTDQVYEICAEVVEAMESMPMAGIADLEWQQTQVLPELPDKWHGIVQFTLTVT